MVKIKHVRSPLLLDAKVLIFDGTISVSDDRRANDHAPTIVHMRRR